MEAERNTNYVIEIIKCLLFCGRQNVSLRAHNEPTAEEFTNWCTKNIKLENHYNPGNFLALMKLLFDAGCPPLKEMIPHLKVSCSYLSHEIQNDLLECIAAVIREKRCHDIMRAPAYSIGADGTVDTSNVEQVTLFSRYVVNWDLVKSIEEIEIREDMFGFIESKGRSGIEIASLLWSMLIALGLDPIKRLLAQVYDGASNMSSGSVGVWKIIQDYCGRLVPYTWCASHSLALVVKHSLAGQPKYAVIPNNVDCIDECIRFIIYSDTKEQLLDSCIATWKDGEGIEGGPTKLKQLVRIRWCQQKDAIKRFMEWLPPMLETLTIIAETWPKRNKEDCPVIKAQGLLSKLQTFEFLVSANVILQVFSIVELITTKLQGKHEDVFTAFTMVEDVYKNLLKIRDEKGSDFNILMDDTIGAAYIQYKRMNGDDAEPVIPRKNAGMFIFIVNIYIVIYILYLYILIYNTFTGRLAFRNTADGDDYKSYYKRNILIPVLDAMILQVRDRLIVPTQKPIVQLSMNLIPSIMIQTCVTGAKDKWLDSVTNAFFETATAATLKPHFEENKVIWPTKLVLRAECCNWYNYWEQKPTDAGRPGLPDSIIGTKDHPGALRLLQRDRENCGKFNLMVFLLVLLATFPVTSCESERSFSALKLIKSRLRSVMSQTRLNSLAFIRAYRDPVDITKVLQKFYEKTHRKMNIIVPKTPLLF